MDMGLSERKTKKKDQGCGIGLGEQGVQTASKKTEELMHIRPRGNHISPKGR